jgi:hypothetical protein
MHKVKINVFSGQFESDLKARAFCDWDYSEDEDDPLCLLAEALGTYDISLDYVEAIYGGGDRFDYIENMLINDLDLEQIKDKSAESDNTLILVMELEENKGIVFDKNPKGLVFCGRFEGKLLH